MMWQSVDPSELLWRNYILVFQRSVCAVHAEQRDLSVGGIGATVISSSLAAMVARLRFPGRNLLFFVI